MNKENNEEHATRKYNWSKISNKLAIIVIIDFLITTIFKKELKSYDNYIYWQILSLLIIIIFLISLFLSYKNRKK